MRRREFITMAGAAAALHVAPFQALAQSKYPERPIRLVIPFPPGGAFDAIGRGWAERMKSPLGTVVVENIGGGGSSLGAAAVARAQPDGHTILLGGGGALVVNPITSRTPYDPIKDFEPIASVATHYFSLAIHPSLPAATLKELIDHARSNPGKLSYGSAGVASLNHLTGELFKMLAGVGDIVHVPYRGAGPATTDLISGQIPMAVPSMNGQMLELHRTGKVRILAVTSPQRLPGAPEIPTAAESGLPRMVSQNPIGLLAPAGTPKAIVEKISLVTARALEDVTWQQQLTASGFERAADASPAVMRRTLEEEIARWSPVIKAVGLKLE